MRWSTELLIILQRFGYTLGQTPPSTKKNCSGQIFLQSFKVDDLFCVMYYWWKISDFRRWAERGACSVSKQLVTGSTLSLLHHLTISDVFSENFFFELFDFFDQKWQILKIHQKKQRFFKTDNFQLSYLFFSNFFRVLFATHTIYDVTKHLEKEFWGKLQLRDCYDQLCTIDFRAHSAYPKNLFRDIWPI